MSMIQVSKVERKIGLKTSQEKYYIFFRNNMSRFPQLFPENVKSFELVGASEIKTGSITRWKYCLDGSPVMSLKAKIEALDDGKKSIYFDVTEGDILKVYKSFKPKIEIGVGYIKVTIEYEKAKEDAPNPEAYLDLAAKVFKGLDTFLSK